MLQLIVCLREPLPSVSCKIQIYQSLNVLIILKEELHVPSYSISELFARQFSRLYDRIIPKTFFD